MTLAVDQRVFDDKGRIAALNLVNLNLRLMECWKEGQKELTGKEFDCLNVMIMLAVVAISTGHLLNSDALAGYESLSRPLDKSLTGECNVSSIAAATGLNRETVRRRVLELEKEGLVAKDRNGAIRLVTGLTSTSVAYRAFLKQLESVARAANQFVEDGFFKRLPGEGQGHGSAASTAAQRREAACA